MDLYPAGLGLLLATAAPAAAGGLDGLLGLLRDQRCDDAFAQVSRVPVPAPPRAEDLAGARELARLAADCRRSDAKVALAFSALAARMAPADPEVQVGHAEALLATDQRGEAAVVLDRTLARDPVGAPRARLLRGQLASQEGEHALAVATLAPLERDPAWGAKVAPLLAESRAAQEDAARRRRALAQVEARAREEVELARLRRGPAPSAPAPPEEPPSAPARTPGQIVSSFPEQLTLGGDHTFVAANLEPGGHYQFRATGECHREPSVIWLDGRPSTRVLRERPRDIFGIDFRVSIGAQQPSRALDAGQQGRPERSAISFVPEAPEVAIRVFDTSTVDSAVRCTFQHFEVAAE